MCTDPDYQVQFKAVFSASGDTVIMEHVSKAIAAFERTVVAGNSPFDRYMYAAETGALSEQELRGLDVYLNKGRCVLSFPKTHITHYHAANRS